MRTGRGRISTPTTARSQPLSGIRTRVVQAKLLQSWRLRQRGASGVPGGPTEKQNRTLQPVAGEEPLGATEQLAGCSGRFPQLAHPRSRVKSRFGELRGSSVTVS